MAVLVIFVLDQYRSEPLYSNMVMIDMIASFIVVVLIYVFVWTIEAQKQEIALQADGLLQARIKRERMQVAQTPGRRLARSGWPCRIARKLGVLRLHYSTMNWRKPARSAICVAGNISLSQLRIMVVAWIKMCAEKYSSRFILSVLADVAWAWLLLRLDQESGWSCVDSEPGKGSLFRVWLPLDTEPNEVV